MSIPVRRSHTSIGSRRKTTEACDPCRDRKLKCDGLLPCKSCEKKEIQCSYDPSTAANKIAGGLDTMNARVVELERAVFGERTLKPRATASMSDSGQISNQNLPGVTVYSETNGTLSFYGTTSTLSLLVPVREFLRHFRSDSEPSEKRQKLSEIDSGIGSAISSSEMLQDQIYETDYRQNVGGLARGLALGENLAAQHFECFLQAVNDTISVLEPSTLRALYEQFWSTSPFELQTSVSRQIQCLIYSVLSLGSLHSESETRSNNAEWASYYFNAAQELLVTLFNASSLKTVQAAMMMAIYAHHTAQPNLAYNYLGTAIRMAYSIGINGSPSNTMAGATDCQSALRTWWTLYSLESDICFEYGKPLCIRETDSKAPYPQNSCDLALDMSKFHFIVANAKLSRIVRKIIDLISSISEKRHPLESFVGRMMNHQAELMTWRGELSVHLAPKYAGTNQLENKRSLDNTSIAWAQRQCFDIELRFNHIMLILHRSFFADATFSTPFYTSTMAKSVSLGAARETILLSYETLVMVPGARHWSCYYHRLLASSLLALSCGIEAPLKEKSSFVDLCSKSMDIFRRMPSGCPRKAIALVETTLAQLRDQCASANEE